MSLTSYRAAPSRVNYQFAIRSNKSGAVARASSVANNRVLPGIVLSNVQFVSAYGSRAFERPGSVLLSHAYVT
jgi:hypothetical protein